MKQNRLFVVLQHLKCWLFILISFSGVLCFAPPIDLICQDCKTDPCKCSTPQGHYICQDCKTDPCKCSTSHDHYIYIGIAVFLILLITALIIYRKRSISKSRISFGDK